MFAQCPKCLTVFSATESQLKARDGMVRCGECAAVFNASWHLLDAIPTSTAAATASDAEMVEPVSAVVSEPVQAGGDPTHRSGEQPRVPPPETATSTDAPTPARAARADQDEVAEAEPVSVPPDAPIGPVDEDRPMAAVAEPAPDPDTGQDTEEIQLYLPGGRRIEANTASNTPSRSEGSGSGGGHFLELDLDLEDFGDADQTPASSLESKQLPAIVDPRASESHVPASITADVAGAAAPTTRAELGTAGDAASAPLRVDDPDDVPSLEIDWGGDGGEPPADPEASLSAPYFELLDEETEADTGSRPLSAPHGGADDEQESAASADETIAGGEAFGFASASRDSEVVDETGTPAHNHTAPDLGTVNTDELVESNDAWEPETVPQYAVELIDVPESSSGAVPVGPVDPRSAASAPTTGAETDTDQHRDMTRSTATSGADQISVDVSADIEVNSGFTNPEPPGEPSPMDASDDLGIYLPGGRKLDESIRSDAPRAAESTVLEIEDDSPAAVSDGSVVLEIEDDLPAPVLDEAVVLEIDDDSPAPVSDGSTVLEIEDDSPAPGSDESTVLEIEDDSPAPGLDESGPVPEPAAPEGLPAADEAPAPEPPDDRSAVAPCADEAVVVEIEDDSPAPGLDESGPVPESAAPVGLPAVDEAPAPEPPDDRSAGAPSTAAPAPDPFNGFPVPDEEIVLESTPPLPQERGSLEDEIDTAPEPSTADRRPRRTDARSATQAMRAAATPVTASAPISDAAEDKASLRSRVTKLGSWIFGCSALVALLLWQSSRFYLHDLAQIASLRPAMHQVCVVFACTVPARRAPKEIDLVGTSISTHPDIPGALRVNVNVINRAEFSQGYPYLEVTLTDKNGRIVGRQNYEPAQYQEFRGRQLAAVDLQPNVVHGLTLDLASPPGEAVGYEVQLLNR
ncbi:MAG: zinc-ribbon domain-containing protein [Gammaproteobacteria bacterium]|nr:zinc-ribbon domain-containing protein [Gammaproteobacteria bacterium]